MVALESIVGIGSIVDDGVVGVNSRPPDVQLWNAQSVLDYHTFKSLFAITISARWSEHNQWLTITPKKPLLIQSPPVCLPSHRPMESIISKSASHPTNPPFLKRHSSKSSSSVWQLKEASGWVVLTTRLGINCLKIAAFPTYLFPHALLLLLLGCSAGRGGP